MRRGSFTEKVRQAARALQQTNSPIDRDKLECAMDLQTFAERRKLISAIRELYLSKELHRVSHGLYTFVDKKAPPEKQEIMWRFFRMQKCLTVDDMVLAADVAPAYAGEFLTNLVKLGIARKFDNDQYQLIKDQLDMPLNDAKAERLQKIRAKKKAKLSLALKKATIAISEAIRFLEDGEGAL